MRMHFSHIHGVFTKALCHSGLTNLGIRLSIVVLLFLGLMSNNLWGQEKNITHLYTNHNGFWSSGVGQNMEESRPNDSHEVLGFTYGGTTFSTGVDDAKLMDENIGFVRMTYQSLPVIDIPIASGSSRFAQFGSAQDGSVDEVDYTKLPVKFPVRLGDLLNDGVNGLDLGTGVTNMKTEDGKKVKMEYPFSSIIGQAEINDGVPDILVSQIAKPIEEDIDQIWFEDAQGRVVGNVIEINQTKLPRLGVSMSDFFDPNTGVVTKDYINSNRDIRMSAYEVSEFGLEENNYLEAERLVYQLGGSSDVAFIAFNMRLFELLIANDDEATVYGGQSVGIDVMGNDRVPSRDKNVPLSIENKPENGSVEIVNGAIQYRPDPYFSGTDIFRYRICSEFLNACHSAYVRVKVIPGKVMVNPAIPVRF